MNGRPQTRCWRSSHRRREPLNEEVEPLRLCGTQPFRSRRKKKHDTTCLWTDLHISPELSNKSNRVEIKSVFNPFCVAFQLKFFASKVGLYITCANGKKPSRRACHLGYLDSEWFDIWKYVTVWRAKSATHSGD